MIPYITFIYIFSFSILLTYYLSLNTPFNYSTTFFFYGNRYELTVSGTMQKCWVFVILTALMSDTTIAISDTSPRYSLPTSHMNRDIHACSLSALILIPRSWSTNGKSYLKVHFSTAKDNHSGFKTVFVCAWDRDTWIFAKTDRLKADLLLKAEHNPLKKNPFSSCHIH